MTRFTLLDVLRSAVKISKFSKAYVFAALLPGCFAFIFSSIPLAQYLTSSIGVSTQMVVSFIVYVCSVILFSVVFAGSLQSLLSRRKKTVLSTILLPGFRSSLKVLLLLAFTATFVSTSLGLLARFVLVPGNTTVAFLVLSVLILILAFAFVFSFLLPSLATSTFRNALIALGNSLRTNLSDHLVLGLLFFVLFIFARQVDVLVYSLVADISIWLALSLSSIIYAAYLTWQLSISAASYKLLVKASS